MIKKIRQFIASEDGPTAVEYAVMLTLIIVICLSAIVSVGTETSGLFQHSSNQLDEIMP